MSLQQLMQEGRTLTLEYGQLMNKKVAGTLTTEESLRLALLEGSLTEKMNQAMGLMGMNPVTGEVATPVSEVSDEDFVEDDSYEESYDMSYDEDDNF